MEKFFFSFIFISWRLVTLCSGFCHTLTWISHGFTCIPHPDPPSHLPLYLIPLGLPSAPGPSTCLMHQPGLVICFTIDNIHVSMLFSRNIPLSPSPTEWKRDTNIQNGKVLKIIYVFFKLLVSFKIWSPISRWEKVSSCKKGIKMTTLVVQIVKHLPAMWETHIWSLSWEDPLEKETAAHSSTLAWKNPMDGGSW